ncbi:hypothetical protein pb186bvf_003045 [Paramecium bursaria]
MKNQNMFSGYQDDSQGDKKSELPIIKILGISSILTFISMMIFDAFVGSKVPQVSSEIFHIYPIPPDIFFVIWPIIFGISITYIQFYFLYLCALSTGIQLGILEHFYLFMFIMLHISFGFISLALVQSMDFAYALSTFSQQHLQVIYLIQGLYLTWKNSFDIDDDSKAQKFIRQSLSFQMGWTASAQCLNLCIFLVYICDMSQKASCYLIWIYLVITHISMTFYAYNQCGKDKQRLIQNFGLYYVSSLWALIGANISIIKNY